METFLVVKYGSVPEEETTTITITGATMTTEDGTGLLADSLSKMERDVYV